MQGFIIYDKVELEQRLGNIVSNIICYKDGQPLMLEIKVTHGIFCAGTHQEELA